MVKKENLGTNTIYSINSLDYAHAREYIEKIAEEEYKGFSVRVFKLNSNYVIDFKFILFNLITPVEEKDLVKAIDDLHGEFKAIRKKFISLRKQILKEIENKKSKKRGK